MRNLIQVGPHYEKFSSLKKSELHWYLEQRSRDLVEAQKKERENERREKGEEGKMGVIECESDVIGRQGVSVDYENYISEGIEVGYGVYEGVAHTKGERNRYPMYDEGTEFIKCENTEQISDFENEKEMEFEVSQYLADDFLKLN
jgi:hypothetical protein